MIITVTKNPHAFFTYNYAMHMMHTQINDLIIANLFIFPHTFLLGQEHFVGRNRVSSGEHCRKRKFPPS